MSSRTWNPITSPTEWSNWRLMSMFSATLLLVHATNDHNEVYSWSEMFHIQLIMYNIILILYSHHYFGTSWLLCSVHQPLKSGLPGLNTESPTYQPVPTPISTTKYINWMKHREGNLGFKTKLSVHHHYFTLRLTARNQYRLSCTILLLIWPLSITM